MQAEEQGTLFRAPWEKAPSSYTAKGTREVQREASSEASLAGS